MEELVLHETGELTELGQITPEKIGAMHQSQDPTDSAFARYNGFEDFARRFGVLVRTIDSAQAPPDQVFQLGAKIDIVLLRQLEYAHHLQGIFAEELALLGIQLLIAHKK